MVCLVATAIDALSFEYTEAALTLSAQLPTPFMEQGQVVAFEEALILIGGKVAG